MCGNPQFFSTLFPLIPVTSKHFGTRSPRNATEYSWVSRNLVQWNVWGNKWNFVTRLEFDLSRLFCWIFLQWSTDDSELHDIRHRKGRNLLTCIYIYINYIYINISQLCPFIVKSRWNLAWDTCTYEHCCWAFANLTVNKITLRHFSRKEQHLGNVCVRCQAVNNLHNYFYLFMYFMWGPGVA